MQDGAVLGECDGVKPMVLGERVRDYEKWGGLCVGTYIYTPLAPRVTGLRISGMGGGGGGSGFFRPN